MVQGLGIHLPMQGDTGSIPGQGTKIPHARQRGKKKKKKIFLNTQLSKQVSQWLPDFLKTKVAILMATLS